MVNYNPKNWWGLIFQLHKSDTFRVLAPAMFSVALFSTVVSIVEHYVLPVKFQGTIVIHTLLGFVISMLLVFRTNTAYDRWWEGRRLWGSLVNSSRNLSLKLGTWISREDSERRERIARLIGEFGFVLKEHLRERKVSGVAPESVHQPNFIAGKLMEEVHALYINQTISGEQLLALNSDLSNMADVCGACERIRKTPIPYSYSIFIKKFIFIYIISMPFALVLEFGFWTILMVTFVFYVLGSLEIIAEEIEDPFGLDANDLPTDEIAETIRKNAEEILVR
jgi:putative membrane protein